MSIDTARRLFQEGLGDKGTCTHATMTYGERNVQLYRFHVTLKDGSRVIVEEPIGRELIADAAKKTGSTFAATRPKEASAPIVLRDGKAMK